MLRRSILRLFFGSTDLGGGGGGARRVIDERVDRATSIQMHRLEEKEEKEEEEGGRLDIMKMI